MPRKVSPPNKKGPATLDGSRADTNKVIKPSTVKHNVEPNKAWGNLDYAFALPDRPEWRLKPKAPGVPSPLGRFLAALVEAGSVGITNFEPASLATLEARDYRYRLVKHKKLEVDDVWESHPGGRHKRWFLRSVVKILRKPKIG